MSGLCPFGIGGSFKAKDPKMRQLYQQFQGTFTAERRLEKLREKLKKKAAELQQACPHLKLKSDYWGEDCPDCGYSATYD